MVKLSFAVVFYRSNGDFIETEKMSNDQINVPLNVPLNIPLIDTERKTLAIISENPAVTVDQIAAILTKSRKTIQRYLNSLQEKKIIMCVGAKKGGHWEIIGPFTHLF